MTSFDILHFQVGQFKNKYMLFCEATCRGDPGAAFLVSTMRTSTYAAQGINTLTRPLLLKNLHKLEQNDKRHLHVIYLTDREGENPDTVSSVDLELLHVLKPNILCHYHSC